MAITFHLPHPHVPHMEDVTRHSTVIIAGLLAASVAVATVVVARSTIGDSLISTSTTATELSATPLATPTKMADRFAPVAVVAGSSMAVFGTDNPTLLASSAAPAASKATQQAINQAQAERQATAADRAARTTPTQGPGSSSLDDTSVDTGSSMAVFGTDNPTVLATSATP